MLCAGVLAATTLPAAGGADRSAALAKASSVRHQKSSLARRSRAQLLALHGLESALEPARSRLASLRAQEQSVARAEQRTRTGLSLARQADRFAQRGLADRLRGLYERGTIEPLEVLLGARSLDEAVAQLDAAERLAEQDRRFIAQTRATHAALIAVSRKLAARHARLTRLRAEAAHAAANLLQPRSAKREALHRLAAARRLAEAGLAAVETELRRAREQARAVFAPAPLAPAPESAFPASDGTLTVTASGYAILRPTATGTAPGWGVVAVDPAVIPFGTRLSIPGYGTGVAADTGSAIRGPTIDLWFPTQAQALAWGRRTVSITFH